VVRSRQRVEQRATQMQQASLWHPVTQDRRVDLVYIGETGVMNEKLIREAVEDALLTQDELRAFIDEFTSSDFDQRNRGPMKENPFMGIPRCISF
jgi:hypothetical protein